MSFPLSVKNTPKEVDKIFLFQREQNEIQEFQKIKNILLTKIDFLKKENEFLKNQSEIVSLQEKNIYLQKENRILKGESTELVIKHESLSALNVQLNIKYREEKKINSYLTQQACEVSEENQIKINAILRELEDDKKLSKRMSSQIKKLEKNANLLKRKPEDKEVFLPSKRPKHSEEDLCFENASEIHFIDLTPLCSEKNEVFLPRKGPRQSGENLLTENSLEKKQIIDLTPLYSEQDLMLDWL
jgi:hypothetical protein